jgi:parallel beta-helix repeat protein
MKIIEKIGLVLLVIGFLGLIVPGLEAAEIKVKCNKGESVQSALDGLTGPATIVVTGTCHENLVIKNDDVSLQGGTYEASDPTIEEATIFVQGARRVAITSVTVKGGMYGVLVYQGASLTLENSLIKETTSRGVVSNFGSSVTVNNCKIKDNTQLGVFVNDNSALVLTNSTITGNHGTGVQVQRASSARIGRDIAGVAGPNKIANNGVSGVGVTMSAYALIDGNTITDNSGDGVYIDGASATVTNNTILNNQAKGVEVNGSGYARIGTTEGNQPGPNTIESNRQQGIVIANGSAANMLSNKIKSNGLTTGRAGVGIYRASARLIGDNTIEANGGHGVEVQQGTLFQGKADFPFTPGPDIITQNWLSGISGWNGASLDIQNATVTNNAQNGIVLSLQSILHIYGSTVSENDWDGIRLWDGSSVARYSNDSPRDSITGNSGWGIVCYGGSNLVGGTGDSGVSGNLGGQVNCLPIVIP